MLHCLPPRQAFNAFFTQKFQAAQIFTNCVEGYQYVGLHIESSVNVPEALGFEVVDCEQGQYFCNKELAERLATKVRLDCASKQITEVGAGNGVMAACLRVKKFKVTEIEIDAAVASSNATIANMFDVTTFSDVEFMNPPYKELLTMSLLATSAANMKISPFEIEHGFPMP